MSPTTRCPRMNMIEDCLPKSLVRFMIVIRSSVRYYTDSIDAMQSSISSSTFPHLVAQGHLQQGSDLCLVRTLASGGYRRGRVSTGVRGDLALVVFGLLESSDQTRLNVSPGTVVQRLRKGKITISIRTHIADNVGTSSPPPEPKQARRSGTCQGGG
jgi:hypothetical protein